MLVFRRPPRSLLVFLGLVVGLGALLGHAMNGAGLALFLLFIASIDAKPSWRFHFDKPGDVDSGRSTMLNSWQRVGATSPKELAKLPSIRD
jgi:hypothetical protein